MTTARRRHRRVIDATERRALVVNVIAYVVANLIMVVVWALTDAAYFWPIWSIVGWGIGCFLHAWSLYGPQPVSDPHDGHGFRKGHGRSII